MGPAQAQEGRRASRGTGPAVLGRDGYQGPQFPAASPGDLGAAEPRPGVHSTPWSPTPPPLNPCTQGLGQLCTPCVLIPLGCGMGGGTSRRHPDLDISSPDNPSDLPASLHETNKPQLTWEGEKEKTPSSEPRQAIQEHLDLTGSPAKPGPGQERHVPPCESTSGEVGSCRW